MSNTLPSPLGGAAPPEVPLPNAPLARVIAQVRFPPILAIRSPDTAAKFQEAVRSSYPILEEDQVRHVMLSSAGTPAVKEDLIWRFWDKGRRWRISLGTGFIAIDTSGYESRSNFLERLRTILIGVQETLDPQEVVRFGIRYVDRIEGDIAAQITNLLKPAVLGIATEDIASVARVFLTEAILPTEEGAEILARWGRLPPNETFDPDVLPPSEGPCWLLDLDMFASEPIAFSIEALMGEAVRYAERLYAVFRWMTKDEFLKAYGGQP